MCVIFRVCVLVDCFIVIYINVEIVVAVALPLLATHLRLIKLNEQPAGAGSREQGEAKHIRYANAIRFTFIHILESYIKE